MFKKLWEKLFGKPKPVVAFVGKNTEKAQLFQNYLEQEGFLVHFIDFPDETTDKFADLQDNVLLRQVAGIQQIINLLPRYVVTNTKQAHDLLSPLNFKQFIIIHFPA